MEQQRGNGLKRVERKSATPIQNRESRQTLSGVNIHLNGGVATRVKDLESCEHSDEQEEYRAT